jgi:hypothetical protein
MYWIGLLILFQVIQTWDKNPLFSYLLDYLPSPI